MDYTNNYYSFSEYENRPLMDPKLHLGRRLTALILCTVFLFPYIYYNIPNVAKDSYSTEFLSQSNDAVFSYSVSGEKNNLLIKGILSNGEVHFTPSIDIARTLQIIIATKNVLITGTNNRFNVFSYIGNDGISYTHITCEEGLINLSLFNESESKVSSFSKILRPDYEAVIFSDPNTEMIGFIRFESDGTNPKPGHGMYSRPIPTESELYEYIEIDPIDLEAYVVNGTYKEPTWSYAVDLSLDSPDEQGEWNTEPSDPSLFPIVRDVMYFSYIISWGEEDTLYVSDEETKTEPEPISEPTSEPAVIEPAPIADSVSLVINDNRTTLGNPDTPLYLDTLTIHENFPANTVTIIGTVYVNKLILVASTGKNESNRVKKDRNNAALAMKNYFRLSKSGKLIIR